MNSTDTKEYNYSSVIGVIKILNLIEPYFMFMIIIIGIVGNSSTFIFFNKKKFRYI